MQASRNAENVLQRKKNLVKTAFKVRKLNCLKLYDKYVYICTIYTIKMCPVYTLLISLMPVYQLIECLVSIIYATLKYFC